MLFTDDTDAALQAAVALVNSTDEPGDPLGSVEDLSAFLASWSYTGRHDASAEERAVTLCNSVLMAVRATDLLLRRMEGQQVEPEILPTRLVPGGTA